MPQTPFSRITYTSRRQNWVFFTLLLITVILAVGLYWGTQRIIDQEQRRFTLDFSTLVGYMNEQEVFLRKLRIENQLLSSLPLPRVASFDEEKKLPGVRGRLFVGRESRVSMPFSVACENETGCLVLKETLFPLGSYLADFYSAFWAASYFPATTVFFVDEADEVSISVPAISVNAGYEPINTETYHAVTDAVRKKLRNGCGSEQHRQGDSEVIWFRPKTLSDQLVGLISAGLPQSLWKNSVLHTDCIYAATLLSRSRIGVLEKRLNPAPEHSFWLQYNHESWLTHRKHGLLLGEDNIPKLENTGLHYTLTGIVLKLSDQSGDWTGIYRVSYGSVFSNNVWLPLSMLVLLMISVASCFIYMRWYNRRVVAPAQEAQREILASEAFNRTLIETAPVALCLIDRTDATLIFANALALDWLGVDEEARFNQNEAIKTLFSQLKNVEQGGSIERLTLPDARIVYVVYAPTCYRQQAVILCAFTDVSAHAEMEQNLTRAKQAADEANDAKSTFLATMSHEIRTPLYGALGTLELLSLTQLNNQQRQYVDRIEGASQMLLQIISDILDISKIEAGQLQLDKSEFNPRELVQECTGAYAGMAYQKGLLLFSIVATDIPERVIGDPVRIRQILNNLISNAIKFTEIGTVVVRLSLLERCSLNAKLLLEVCDSGVGIDKAEQEKLFTPFYVIDSANHMAGGAGLGMSICARLAELMNTKIQLRSEPQMGSQFSVELNTELTEAGDTLTPQLKGTSVLVRTPHPELTENIGDWLKHWGAELATETDALFTTDGQTILLDIVRKVTEITEEWQWLRLDLSLSGEAVASSDVDAYNLSSIGFGLERLQHGVQCTKSRVPTLPHFNLRILVAEDNPLNQVTLKGQLEKLGCEVTIADDGEEALALWDISPHDMVMTDVNMPYLNGYELARKLRSEGVTSPIIGVTANAMRDEERRCIEAGMNAWLVKPIELKELAELLRKNVQPGWIDEAGDEKAFILPEPNVLEKHRNIFLASMREDLQHLADGITQKDADSLIMTLHRMRGALVLAQFRELASEMEILEQQIQASRLNEGCLVDVVAMAAEINQLLVQIESTS